MIVICICVQHKSSNTQIQKSAHSIRPGRCCVRLERFRVLDMARTKERGRELHSFQMNQLGFAIHRRWRKPYEVCQETLLFFSHRSRYRHALSIPKNNDHRLQKQSIFFIILEIEVHLKICDAKKPKHIMSAPCLMYR